MREFKNHDIVDDIARPGVRYEKRPAKRPDGSVAEGLYNAWIWLDNPTQFNSYTTDMVKGVILAGWRLLRCNPWSHGGADYARDQRIFPLRGRS